MNVLNRSKVLSHGAALCLALGLAACGDDGTGTATLTTTEAPTLPGTTSTSPATDSTVSTPTDTGIVSGTGTSTAPTSEPTSTGGSTEPATEPSDSSGETTMGVTTMTTSTSSTTGMTTDTTTDATTGGSTTGVSECQPGDFQCAGDVSQKCGDDETWHDYEDCDGLQGLMCDPNVGACLGVCSKFNLGQSYIGCDYYPVSLANLHETQPWTFHYSVVVANTTGQAAQVTITRGPNMIKQLMVAANSAQVVQLPYVDALITGLIDDPGPSLMVQDGAYRVRSTQPVSVYQYEPLEYQINGSFSFTNDASLLLPVNTWTGNYIVASRQLWYAFGTYNLPGYYAVVAQEDNTTVTVTPSATGKFVQAGGGIAANGTGQVVLNESDVLEVFTELNGFNDDNLSDLTGTMISADKPVSVFGGHKCTQIPIGVDACDRLEEAMPPIETLAKEYLVTPPFLVNNQVKAQMIRVIATEAATTISYDPPQNGAPTNLVNAGDFFEIPQNANNFKITADKKVLVAQYMQSQGLSESGDPAMALAVATAQYRMNYLIHAPLLYEKNFANVTAPMGANVTMDGNPINGFTAIGGSGYGVARVTIPDNADGNHTFDGDQKFGVSIYGYGQYTSYWYPGGLDLEAQPQ